MRRWMVLSVLCFTAHHLPAQERQPGMTDRWNLSFGSFSQNVDTEVRADSDQGMGNDLDFEDDLGFDPDTTETRLDGYYRFGRHRIDFGYHRFRRTSVRVIDETIVFGDRTFEVDSTIDAFFNTDYFKLGYRYSFVKKRRTDFGLAAGFSTFDLEAGLALALELSSEGEVLAVDEGVSVGVTAPAPLVGLYFNRQLHRGLLLRAVGEFFALDLDEFDGSVTDIRTVLDYYPWRRIGFGLGYNYVEVEIDQIKIIEDIQGRYQYNFDGWQLYLTFSF
ncbi:MAG: hypothetical protein QNK37_03120 [Acidobacteriota bacterium]|nr:hypothetical protein [Acidobacteriota bacterium]